MQSLHAAFAALCVLAGTASAQFIPGVTTTSGMGTFSTYNILNLTNGVGLSSMSLSATHSATWQDMWITNAITTGWVQFDLGSVQPLNAIAVWNYNSSISTQRGVRLMDVSTSVNGVNWTPLSQELVPQANAQPVLPHLIGGGGVPCQFVRFDVLSNWGNNYTGLSEVQFVAGSNAVFGSNTTLGHGCIRAATSFYELFPTAASFDLSNSAFSMIPNGPGYLVVPGTNAFVPPSASAVTLALANNSSVAAALSGSFPYPGGSAASLSVCSNGYVAVAAGNTTSGTPTATTMLNAPQTGWWVWHDYNPAAVGGGPIQFEQVGPVAYVTWNGVWDNAGTTAANASTFQLQFDTATGVVHVVMQAMSALGNGYLVGYSPGGASLDHGSTDLSVALPGSITIGANDVLPLTLNGTSRPVIGTTWTLSVTNVPAASPVGIDVWGLSDPNIPDLGFMGAPGCSQRSALDVVNVWIVAGGTHSYALVVPNDPTLVNVHVFTMAAVLQPGVNTMFGGAITSNGIDGRIGDL